MTLEHTKKKTHIKLGLNKHQCNNSTRLHKIILPQKNVIQVWNNIHKVEYINILIVQYPLKFLISKVDGSFFCQDNKKETKTQKYFLNPYHVHALFQVFLSKIIALCEDNGKT